MKTVFIFILGMLIAIFLLLPENGNSLPSNSKIDQPSETVSVVVKNKKLNKVDKLIISMAKSMINTDQVEMDANVKIKSKKQPTNYNAAY